MLSNHIASRKDYSTSEDEMLRLVETMVKSRLSLSFRLTILLIIAVLRQRDATARDSTIKDNVWVCLKIGLIFPMK